MLKSPMLLAAVGIAAWTAVPVGAAPAFPLTTGNPVVLTRYLIPEKPTLFLFYKPSSTMERSFVTALQKDLGARAGIQLVPLKTGAEPVAKQYEVTETPTALVYDRRGRLVGRNSDAEQIRAAARKAAGVMRIDWAADDDPRMDQVEKLLGRRPAGGILRTMSLQPEWLAAINQAANTAHFREHALTRRQHEMIASYVSALNKCKY